MNTSFVILAEQEGEDDQFRENVNLIKQDLTGYGIKMDDFVRLSEAQVTEMIENGKILESCRLKKKWKRISLLSIYRQTGRH